MSPTENPEGLLAMTRTLVRKVEGLDQHLKLTQMQARRMKILTIVSLAFTLISIAGVIVTVSLYQQVHDAVELNQRNAVTSCENGNESRKANLTLWQFVLSASAANNPPKTPAEKKFRDDFESWVKRLYALRDCSNLSAKVDIPPPPQISPR